MSAVNLRRVCVCLGVSRYGNRSERSIRQTDGTCHSVCFPPCFLLFTVVCSKVSSDSIPATEAVHKQKARRVDREVKGQKKGEEGREGSCKQQQSAVTFHGSLRIQSDDDCGRSD